MGAQFFVEGLQMSGLDPSMKQCPLGVRLWGILGLAVFCWMFVVLIVWLLM